MQTAAIMSDWSTGFCSWCAEPGGFGLCLYTYFCPCCSYGSMVGKMGPEEVFCGGNCCGACCCYAILWDLGLCCLLHMGARRRIREKYGIQSNGCNDCMLTMCCPLCAICQETRQLSKST
ncbi:hypothetical protein PLESTB_001000300 [Pleodorina starrii]|uniref:Uncharacterized protein n=1 Tax=Pleodorina starrii TaxID=330485 RepID=A0A9W6F3W4_9CHLO|nr:hypothetical protein PLESTM_001859300 [Pleodorina starrii]GLC55558.1 hypothetical protein PLESTB_001000300 [Pleodorina starrii]